MQRLSGLILTLLAFGTAALVPAAASVHRHSVPAQAGKACFKRTKVHGKFVRKRVTCPKPRPTAPPPKPAPPPPPPGSTRDNPIALGSEGSVPEWRIKINSVDFDAWPSVQAANMFNDPPAPGWSDVVVSLTMTYTGSDTGTPWLDNELHYVGASNIAYPEGGFDHDCGVAPSPKLDDFGDVFTGGTVTGNVCFQAQTADVGSLVGYWDTLGSTTLGPWFSLR